MGEVRKVNVCIKHVPSTSGVNITKTIYLFQVTPCSPCGILLRTKLICSKHVYRLVSVRVFYNYVRWGIHCIQDHIEMLYGFSLW